MNVREYAGCDATELSSLIATNKVSADEVRAAALRAIEKVEPHVNAVVHGPFDDAAAVPDGSFAGVPFAAKDTLFETGRPVEFGSRLLAGHVAGIDATLAERFRAAGLVGLVRTATPEFTFNLDTSPVVNGPTRNPWAIERSPGGSSGGSAALVAARAVPVAHANDGGGSIRIPAAWCGLVGLKPTRGRVPVGPLIGESAGAIGHEFAVTRSVRDTARLLDAVAGPAPGDRYYVERPRRPFAEELNADPGSLRIAVHTDSFWGRETQPDVRAAVEQVARCLEELGHVVEEANCPVSADVVRTAHLVWWPWFVAGLATALGAVVGREASGETVEAASHACIRRGLDLTATDVAVAAAIQNVVSRAWGGFLDDYDLFLCPTTPTGPPESGTPAQDDPAYGTAAAWVDEAFDWLPYTPIANMTGQPAISLPLGISSDGLPIGVMLTAQALREDLLFRVAAQLEEALPWADRAPAVVAG